MVAWIQSLLSKSSSTFQPAQPARPVPDLSLNNFQNVFHDGILLCQLLLSIDPNLPGIQECVDQPHVSGQRRWSVLLRVIENRFHVPQLFSADDIANKIVDKVCTFINEIIPTKEITLT